MENDNRKRMMDAFKGCDFEKKEIRKAEVNRKSCYRFEAWLNPGETLVDRLRQADAEEAKELFEGCRKKYPLLEDVIAGRTTFHESYKPAAKMYKGIYNLGFYGLIREIKKLKKLRENKGIINDYGLLSYKNITLNSTGAVSTYGVLMFAVVGVAVIYMGRSPALGIAVPSVAAILSALTVASLYRLEKIGNMTAEAAQLGEDLKYLDKKVREIYL